MSTSREHKRAAQKRAQDLQSRRDYVAALEEEKRGYQVRGLKDRAKAVDAEIRKARETLGEEEPPEGQEPETPEPPASSGKGSARAALEEDFDPTEKKVEDVVTYFERDDVDDAKVERVKEIERKGKARTTITDWQPKADAPAS